MTKIALWIIIGFILKNMTPEPTGWIWFVFVSWIVIQCIVWIIELMSSSSEYTKY